MMTETMIARTEYQLMQADVAQMQACDGVVVEVVEGRRAGRGLGLLARIRSSFAQTKTNARREDQRAARTALRWSR